MKLDLPIVNDKMKKITSVDNETIKYLISLKQYSTQKLEKKYIVEGINIVNEAIKNNCVEKIFTTQKNLSNLSNFDNVVEITEKVAKKLSDVKTNQEIFGLCRIDVQKVDFNSNILILDNIQDPGNMGTLIRSAKAFGFNTIVASTESVNFYNTKVIRATQGNHFDVNLINCELKEFIEECRFNDFKIISTFLNNKSTTIKELNKIGKCVLILGNEGNGISQILLETCDFNIKIETSINIESLNVAIAGSILMSEIFQKIKGE